MRFVRRQVVRGLVLYLYRHGGSQVKFKLPHVLLHLWVWPVHPFAQDHFHEHGGLALSRLELCADTGPGTWAPS